MPSAFLAGFPSGLMEGLQQEQNWQYRQALMEKAARDRRDLADIGKLFGNLPAAQPAVQPAAGPQPTQVPVPGATPLPAPSRGIDVTGGRFGGPLGLGGLPLGPLGGGLPGMAGGYPATARQPSVFGMGGSTSPFGPSLPPSFGGGGTIAAVPGGLGTAGSPYGPGTTPTQYGGGGTISPVPEWGSTQQTAAVGGMTGPPADWSSTNLFTATDAPASTPTRLGRQLYGGGQTYEGRTGLEPFQNLGDRQPITPGMALPAPSEDWLQPSTLRVDGTAAPAVGGGPDEMYRPAGIPAANFGGVPVSPPGAGYPPGTDRFQTGFQTRGPGMAPAATAGYQPTADTGMPRTADLRASATPAEQAALADIVQRESGGRYDIRGPFARGEWHTGAHQFADSTWQRTARATGLGTQFAQAKDAPREIQDANALYLYRTEGERPWATSAPGRMYADANRSMSPQEHAAGHYSTIALLQNYPQMPQVVSAMDTARQLAQMIQQALPGAGDEEKGAVFMKMFPMMSEMAKDDAANQWDRYKAQVHQLEYGAGLEEKGREFDIRQEELREQRSRDRAADWDIMETDQGLVRVNKITGQVAPVTGVTGAHKLGTPQAERFGAPENYTITKPDGTTQEVLARTETSPAGRLGLVDQDGRPINVPSGATIRKTGVGETRGGGLALTKQIEYTDKDGNSQTVLVRERRDQAGWVDSITGKPWKPPEGATDVKEVTAGTAGGGRAGAQIGRQIVAGGEVTRDLQNVQLMPVGTTTGMFGGVSPGTSLVGAVQGDLARVLTTEDEINMKQSMAGLGRELSTLMSPVYGGNWASEQLEPLIPKAGYTINNSLYGIARIKQSAIVALESLQTSPIVGREQKVLANKLIAQINQAIPWDVKDVIAFQQQANPQETFGEYAKRTVSAAPGAAPEVSPEEYKKLPSGAAYRVPGDPQTHYKP